VSETSHSRKQWHGMKRIKGDPGNTFTVSYVPPGDKGNAPDKTPLCTSLSLSVVSNSLSLSLSSLEKAVMYCRQILTQQQQRL
jgi:hypothetical protein